MEKKPVCQHGFTWRGEFYKISNLGLLYEARQVIARMREAHL